jgi:hypothetical protein
MHKSSANDRVFVPLLVVLRQLNSIEVDDFAPARVSSDVPATRRAAPVVDFSENARPGIAYAHAEKSLGAERTKYLQIAHSRETSARWTRFSSFLH